MHRMFIVFNWKAHPLKKATILKLLKSVNRSARLFPKTSIIVAPSFVDIETVSRLAVSSVSVASQDVAAVSIGSYTGQVPSALLARHGVRYVIVGHSEGRRELRETDALIAKKCALAAEYNMTPIVCVGEWTRTSTHRAWLFVKKQLGSLKKSFLGSLIIAYEPVWAIGGNKTVDPDHVAAIATEIKRYMHRQSKTNMVKVLYGGSVSGKTIESLCARSVFDGFLIGSAGLVPAQIEKIIRATNHRA